MREPAAFFACLSHTHTWAEMSARAFPAKTFTGPDHGARGWLKVGGLETNIHRNLGNGYTNTERT